MKLSINFLKDYVDLDKDIDVIKLAEDMTNAGNEYDEAGKLILNFIFFILSIKLF